MSDEYTITQPTATVDILNRGMKCLVDGMGIVEAETFIASIQRERFDYTKWHEQYFTDSMNAEEFSKAAVAYADSQGKLHKRR